VLLFAEKRQGDKKMKKVKSILLGLIISLATLPAHAEFVPSVLQQEKPPQGKRL
jgi:hypothetical protein